MARAFATVLPTPRTSLLGRAWDIATVSRSLLDERVPLLTFTGPGGVGKTRLALAVASALETEYGDGAVFFPLAAVRDAALVLPTIARVLGLRESPGAPLAETLASVLRDQEMLLVLDNLEQVAEAAPDLATLLETCPRVQILATSRVRLRLSAEHLHPVLPLPTPATDDALSLASLASNPAVALFTQRARQVQPAFALTEANSPSVVAIVSHLDGLPLAIELAATRIAILSPEALLVRLDRRLRLLTGGPNDTPPRLQSMHDAIAWSYDLLDPAQKALLRRLSVFVGGFDVEAAIAVSGEDSVAILNGLRALADHSLIQPASPSDPDRRDDAPDRFAMLETVREFALEQLAASGEHDMIEAARAGFVCAFAEAAEPHLFGPEERRWTEVIDAELANVRAALAWTLDHDVEVGLRIAAALWMYWAWRLQLTEGRSWLDRLLSGDEDVGSAARYRALTTAGALAMLSGEESATVVLEAEAIRLARAEGDRLAEARATLIAAAVPLARNEFAEAALLFDRSLELFAAATTSTDRSWAAYARAYRGMTAAMLGQTDAALALYEDALAQAREAGSAVVTLLILDDFGGLLLEVGDRTRARTLITEALTLAAGLGEVWPAGHALCVLAGTDVLDGALNDAARRIGAAEKIIAFAGLTMPPPLQQRLDRTVAQDSAGLGEEAFTAARQAGCSEPTAVIAEALAGRNITIHAAFGSNPVPDALTLRERDVLRLLVHGQSDKQIAEQLFISRKTASNHVSSILAKLGVTNRAAAVAKAIEQGMR